MRTTWASMARDTSAGIETASQRLARYQRLVSSGKRVATPSDDPQAASQIVSGYAEKSTLERYSAAAKTTSSRLTVIDSVMGDIVSSLSQAQVAVTSALGSANAVSQAQRDAAARTLSGVRDTLFADLNQTYAGTQIFAGSATTTPPYTKAADGTISAYAGTGSELRVDANRGQSVAVTIDGSRITQGSDSEDVFTVLDAAIVAARSGDSQALTAGMAALKRAFERASAIQGEVGTSLNTLSNESSRLQTQQQMAAARISNLEDADMTKAITGMTDAETSYRAALGAASTALKVSLLDYLK